MAKNISRRDFLRTGTLAAAGLTIVPSAVLGKSFGHTAPSDRLNIAGIGVGGRGSGVLKQFPADNIVALCDVDWGYSANTFKSYPKAQRFRDFRKMYDEIGKSIDAVMVATADHTHAIIAAQAIEMGKHVYCEKPLTHTVYETRLLTKLADKHQVATQMGNQGASEDGVRKTCEAVWSGMIGEVTRVEAFTDRPIWPQGLPRPVKVERTPKDLDWDLFLGPAANRPFNSIYTPWNWRGWWDFGTGALGDMACHILQPVVKALNLKYPTQVEGSSTVLLTDCAPNAQRVRFIFPARDNMPKLAMPEVEVIWYDGGLQPDFPKGWPAGKSLNDNGGGVIFYGTKDILVCGCYGKDPWLISGREIPAPTMTRAIPDGHYMDFINACKESPSSRRITASNFGEAGLLNEMVVMGVLGVRLQGLNRTLDWDGENMQFTNIKDDDVIRIMKEDGFSIKDGHPTFNKAFTDPINAKAFAAELIQHTYREGYELPKMPV
ncbi:MAG: Gfo/Idh/MocA family oxidoreductase [Bacteroidales bacterium]